MQTSVIILAAGKGKRMHSNLPKVLHTVGGQPMIKHLTALSEQLCSFPPIIIYGHEGDKIQNALADQDIRWVEQKEQLGTGHAVMQTVEHLDDTTLYLILVGDAPLIRAETIQQLSKTANDTGIAVLTVHTNNPFGYGRIVRDTNGHVMKIVEEKDTNADEKTIQEINSGVFAIRGDLLNKLLPQISNDNAQQEYYLTDIVALANNAGHATVPYLIEDIGEVLGCNNKIQLAQLERIYQQRQAQALMEAGVTLTDPNRIDIRGTVSAGMDCWIDINVVFEGSVTLGDNVTIEPNCIIRNSHIGNHTIIKANSVIDQSNIGNHAEIGPFARIRPKTQLGDNTKVGNFVETKNAQVANGAKINHLSYIGDSIIGERVNIGAGTITCNYDGVSKHQTVIEKDCFIGSNTALVAPVTVGANATVGAGSTITKDVTQSALAVARGKQVNIENWKSAKKADKQ